MEETIDLSKLFLILKKNIKYLIVLPIVFLALSMVITFVFMTPKYSSSTQVLVNQKETDNQMMAQQVQSNLQLVNTYSEIIKSPRILDKVSKNLKGKYSSKELSGMLTVSNQAESQILNIAVENESREAASKVANEIANVFSKDVSKIMNVDNVSILSKADNNGSKVSPKPLINAVVGVFLGLIIALIIIFLKEIMDKRIKTEEDVEEVLGLPVLGTIQDFSK
ncbi:Wzz/FepE/Etk N-terminal domain-containing protein [Mammaliicoccus sciuri]|uniref:Wzz/FepE/Etk N-terminal domain-containing protein n=1 Tax=Mammaliicoccus sciuri TaxID=1296 RepID=UPI00194FE277|nr:Wzz/FepE/Etk N-terminal domain-containing protein [Mammaliicoccus sciuri]MCO4323974.1 Wzz/FepE/Etk N-terminal domain-containing protein [Mammaliicoccus sciuri]MEB6121378.1 Wzz/FepE/Etk N-terminal domain-containing protein [Mammaliicoccus sciuri]MEB6286901.1 Wzz/FepE/Etk N-terminal domain-containing protein [Mammaliicoccus sciuri]MEB6312369.1 Wzz/FepE/Etk N-terminal domain-containing protein [Mammaliicoccus sciuri]MEB6695165.1 Wzz/FepE/Etk N-terminal domain-containing protein [Mammaliicoccus